MCSLQSIFTTSLPPLSNCLTIRPSNDSFSIRSLTSQKKHSRYFQLYFATCPSSRAFLLPHFVTNYNTMHYAWDWDIKPSRMICITIYQSFFFFFFKSQNRKRLKGTSSPQLLTTPWTPTAHIYHSSHSFPVLKNREGVLHCTISNVQSKEKLNSGS